MAGGELVGIGGGPCHGTGGGSDVCSNTTSLLGDPLLSRFDLNDDGVVDRDDELELKRALGKPHYDEKYDINGDGALTGLDLKVWRLGQQEFEKRNNGRRTYKHLRGRH